MGPPVQTSHGTARRYPRLVLLAVCVMHPVVPVVVPIVSFPATTATAVPVIVTVVPAPASAGLVPTIWTVTAGRQPPQLFVPVSEIATIAEAALSVFPPAGVMPRAERVSESTAVEVGWVGSDGKCTHLWQMRVFAFSAVPRNPRR